MPRILFVASHWPPIGGAPAYRPVKFAKALSEMGHDVSVLTAEALPEPAIEDPTLGAGVKKISVLRARVRSPRRVLGAGRIARAFEIPDPFVGWLGPAIRLAQQTFLTPPDAIWTTSPPYTTLAVGARLARAWSVPWIADLRDLGADNPFYARKHPLRRSLERAWERRYLVRADRITATTEGIAAYLRDQYGLDAISVPTGYDEDDFQNPRPVRRAGGDCVVAHVGALHGARNIVPFLRAMERLEETVCFRQIGFASGEARRHLEAAKADLPGRIEIVAQVPYRRAIEEILSADLLLVIEHSSPTYGTVLPQKLFPYLRASAPILALSPPNEMTRILEATRRGRAIWPADPARIAEEVKRMQSDRQATSVSRLVRSYEVRRTAARLAELLF